MTKEQRAARRDEARRKFFAGETVTLDEIRRDRHSGSKAMTTCSTCNDTHTMPATGFMCTRCPVPCRDCGAAGPFCTTTPCLCRCHAPSEKRALIVVGGQKFHLNKQETWSLFGQVAIALDEFS